MYTKYKTEAANNKKSKTINFGKEPRKTVKAPRAHGFVPSRGFPQDCTCTALARQFGL